MAKLPPACSSCLRLTLVFTVLLWAAFKVSTDEAAENQVVEEGTHAAWTDGVSDESIGDLCCGPRGSNYTVSSCLSQCTGYSYFVVEAGGVCSCDHEYKVPASLRGGLCGAAKQKTRCGLSDTFCPRVFSVQRILREYFAHKRVSVGALTDNLESTLDEGLDRILEAATGNWTPSAPVQGKPQEKLPAKELLRGSPTGLVQKDKEVACSGETDVEEVAASPYLRGLLSHSGELRIRKNGAATP
ncbi:hypothetical protein CYMTET_48556 [Cymbomonas tetramitiformis]|uniref:Uncharacterized protein n=1 Tax=Cymbomonas tetramitiformis TaxID=36881 RepID=A0AAE0BTB4_9CHLO|nr:hypothetical protein CYMTET_48556 [Cymbomonas tetramitiformis]